MPGTWPATPVAASGPASRTARSFIHGGVHNEFGGAMRRGLIAFGTAAGDFAGINLRAGIGRIAARRWCSADAERAAYPARITGCRWTRCRASCSRCFRDGL